MIFRVIALIIGYFWGTIQTGYIYGKMRGVDIRQHGSGNTGATNSLRTFGWQGGLITFVGDCFKAVLSILIVQILLGNSFEGSSSLLEMYAGIGAVLGHNFPFYLKFKGGKGIACTVAVILCACPITAPVCLIVFFSTVFLSKYVSLGSILMVLSFMIQVLIFNSYGMLGIEESVLLEFNILSTLFCIMAIIRHKDNIVRLLNGTEHKIGKKSRQDE